MSAEMGSSTKAVRIYIPLMNEGTDVFRPTLGSMIGNNVYKVLPTDSYENSGEEWKFPPGSIVECMTETKSGQVVLVATKAVNY